MSQATQERAGRASIRRHGQDVDLYNYTEQSDSYSSYWDPTGKSPQTISARVQHRTTPRPGRDVRESGDVEADFALYIKAPQVLILESGESHTIPAAETEFYRRTQVDANATLTVNGTLIVGFIDGIRDGGGQGASAIDIDQDGAVDIRVMQRFDEKNGIIRLDCERID